MKITGIIAEFNPFHNGHKYLISQAREKTGCDFVVIAMSGDFVQRGTPAIVDKFLRTQAALLNGADLVIQLPVIASTASASTFALSGVSTLSACGVDTIVFGCEDENLSLFSHIADILNNEPSEFQALLSDALKSGLNYPAARANALKAYLSTTDSVPDNLPAMIESPNNILAIEYIRAIKKLNLSMNYLGVKRLHVDHHSFDANNSFASASSLRNSIYNEGRFPMDCVPASYLDDLLNYLKAFPALHEDSFSEALRYKILSENRESLCTYLDGSAAISNRIYNQLDSFSTLSDFALSLKTKDNTYTRLMRFFAHLLLNIKTEHLDLLAQNYAPYLRVLGFKKEASNLLSYVKQVPAKSNTSLITSVKDFSVANPEEPFFSQDLFARELYRNMVNTKKTAGSLLKNDYQQPFITL